MTTYHTYSMPTYTVSNLYLDLSQEVNVLIAGWVGSGKSESIHGIIHALICTHTPDEVHFFFCDPKMVELERWRGLPHCKAYADTEGGILEILSLTHSIMMSRYAEMKRRGLVKWDGTHLYLVIDELADLMTGPRKRDFSQALAKIMQLSRAAGIHVIAGTQKASRQVIPAQLQCNFTAAVALKCYSAIESRQVIGIAGAEELPGPGVGYVNHHGEVVKYLIPMVSEVEKSRLLRWWTEDGVLVKTEHTIAKTGLFARLFRR